MENALSRRNFIGGALIAGAGMVGAAALSGCAGKAYAKQDTTGIKWDKEADVVIVGGGVTGAAVGYGLAKRGVKTCLVDAVPTFSRASRANMGLIWCQSKALGCPQFVRWGFASSRAYGKLAAELKELSGIDTGYAPTGGIIPCLGEAELEARAQFIEKLRAETEDGTYPASVLSRKELEGMLPKVPFGPEVSGGIWSDMDGYVDPLHLMFAFRKSFVRLGGTLFAGERVSEVKPSGVWSNISATSVTRLESGR